VQRRKKTLTQEINSSCQISRIAICKYALQHVKTFLILEGSSSRIRSK
jgi:hypothetical protein